MDFDTLVTQIDENGDFHDRDHAQDALTAVLAVLGERLEGGSPRNLAAQLPGEAADALPPQGGAQSFGIDEFDRLVAKQESRGCSPAAAHAHAVAVMNTVLRCVTTGEAKKIASQLPSEYSDLVPVL